MPIPILNDIFLIELGYKTAKALSTIERDHASLMRGSSFLQIKRNDGLVHLEFPRGFGEKGETSAETAKRELKEETNLDGIAIQKLGIVMPDSGLIDAKIPIFEIEVNNFDNIILQKSEKIFGYETADRRILRSLILDKSIVDGYTLAGCLYLNI